MKNGVMKRALVILVLLAAGATIAHLHVSAQTYHPVVRLASSDGFTFSVVQDAVRERGPQARLENCVVDRKRCVVRIVVRIVRDECAVALDTSGESLNRRGYRANPSEASLKETLAAGLLLLAGWQGDEPLIDPACGAGTIPIEARTLACVTSRMSWPSIRIEPRVTS